MSRESELSERIRQAIPLAATMGVVVERLSATEVELSAPLAPNVNDKGCAFGGSLVSLLTLAGWALVREAMAAHEQEQEQEPEIYVADSRVEYLRPVEETLRAIARFPAAADLASFARRFRERGRARIPVLAELRLADGRLAGRFEAQFAAVRASSDDGSR